MCNVYVYTLMYIAHVRVYICNVCNVQCMCARVHMHTCKHVICNMEHVCKYGHLYGVCLYINSSALS